MRGTASAVATAFPVLAAVALAVVLVAAAAIARVPLCCCRTVLRSCHYRHCRPRHHHCHDIQSPSPRCPCLVAYPLLLSLQLSLPCHPRSHRCCCHRVNPALALADIAATAIAAAQPHKTKKVALTTINCYSCILLSLVNNKMAHTTINCF